MSELSRNTLAVFLIKVVPFFQVLHKCAHHRASNPYWHQVALFYDQFEGLARGYAVMAEKKGASIKPIPKGQIFWMNVFGDLEDLEQVRMSGILLLHCDLNFRLLFWKNAEIRNDNYLHCFAFRSFPLGSTSPTLKCLVLDPAQPSSKSCPTTLTCTLPTTPGTLTNPC